MPVSGEKELTDDLPRPTGLFRVTEIEPAANGFEEAAFGYFVGDHPRGYKGGEVGRYLTRELKGREVTCES